MGLFPMNVGGGGTSDILGPGHYWYRNASLADSVGEISGSQTFDLGQFKSGAFIAVGTKGKTGSVTVSNSAATVWGLKNNSFEQITAGSTFSGYDAITVHGNTFSSTALSCIITLN